MNATTTQTATSGERSILGPLWRSSIAAKWVMAVTGVLFLLWLIGHLAGNLAIFGGSEVLNSYAALLKANAGVLWLIRGGLILVVVLHVIAGIRLSTLNRAARAQRYEGGYRYRKASWASRSMLWSGLVILAFLIFHLVHFTWGGIFPSYFDTTDAAGRHDVYRMVVQAFSHWWMVVIYVGAMILVGLHLSHAIWSSTQTFGLNGKKWTLFSIPAGKWIGIAIAVGFIVIPLAVLIGIVRLA